MEVNKKDLSERDIVSKFILPGITNAGWSLDTQIREEVSFTDGRIFVKGKTVVRGQKKCADIILYYKPNMPIAVVEAKDNKHYVSDGVETNYPASFRTTESADLFLLLMMRYLKDGGRAAIVLPDGSLTGDGVKERIRKEFLTQCNVHTIVRLPNSVFQPYASVATNLLFFTKGEKTKDVWYYEHKVPEGMKAYSKTKPIQKSEFEPLKKWWNKRKKSDVAWKVSIKELEENGYNLDIKNPTVPEEETVYTTAELMQKLHESFKASEELLNDLRKGLSNGK